MVHLWEGAGYYDAVMHEDYVYLQPRVGHQWVWCGCGRVFEGMYWRVWPHKHELRHVHKSECQYLW